MTVSEEVFTVELVVNRSTVWCVHSFQLTTDIITDITRPKTKGKEDGECVLTAGHLLQALPHHVLYNYSEWDKFPNRASILCLAFLLNGCRLTLRYQPNHPDPWPFSLVHS